MAWSSHQGQEASCQHLEPIRLAVEVLPAPRRQPIHPPPSAVLRLPATLDPATFFEAMEDGIERAMPKLEQPGACLGHVEGDLVAVLLAVL